MCAERIVDVDYEMRGVAGPGTGGAGSYTWKNNLTKLIWEIKTPFLTLNTTVLYSLNTRFAQTIFVSFCPHECVQLLFLCYTDGM